MGKDKDKDKDKKERRERDDEVREHRPDKLEFEASLPLEQVLSYLDGLRQKLASGELEVRSGDTVVTLRPEGAMRLRVGADESDNRHRIRFDISWNPNPAPELEFISVGAPEDAEASSKSKNGRERASK